ncbi:RES domain-containing protein [Luteimonas sp. MJ204]|uniref:RES domain-containing protein n=1 Tax=Luteimonas sp. MJ145 TaxID=3129234 RepID=UPI0031BACA92
MIIKQLPHAKVLQEELRKLRSDRSPKTVEQRLSALLKHYDVLNYDRKFNTPLHRAQRSNETGFRSIGRLLHPPAHHAEKGRLNEKGESRLYASLDVQTCLAELDAKKNDCFHVVGLMPRERKLRCAAVGHFDAAHKDGAAAPLELRQALSRISRSSPREATLAFLFFDAMLASLINDVHARDVGYIYSRTLARLLLAKYPAIDAIQYPSVRRPIATNLMIREQPASHMEVVGTSVLQIREVYDFGFYDFEIIREAVGWNGEGEIQWKS